MYTLIDGVQFYDKDEVDDMLAQSGSTGLSARLDQEAIDRTAADDALGARIDQEAQELSDKLAQEAQELSDKLTQESNVRLLGDQTLANQLTAIEQLWSTLISANFIDTDSNTIVVDDSGKSIRQIAHDEFYRQLVTDADNVKQQLDTLKELADYLQNNPTILTDVYTKLGLTWSLDTPTDFGTFDFSRVLAATDVDSAIVELHNALTNKAGDLTQLTTSFKGNIVGAVNELDAEVGDLSTLSTVEKGTIVGAINSEFEWRRKNDETLGTRISDEVTDRMNADSLLDGRIGLLNSLKTTNKSSTVSAINELYDTVQQNGGGSGGGSVPTPTPSDGVAIISIALQSNVTGSGEYTETVDLTDLAECVASNKPYLFEVTAKLPMADYTFKNCSAVLIEGAHTTHFDINLLNDIVAADAAKLAFTLNHADATNTSVTFTLNDNVTIGGGGGDSGTGTDTAQLEAKLNAEITARTQADADLGARIDAEVGDLSTLTTTAKVSVVAAINEVKTLAVTGSGGGGGSTGIDTTQLEAKIGDLSALTTTNKGSVVAAINEVNGKVGAGGGSGGSTATNYTPFTFIIDSDEALSEWANNDKSKGQDYTSILIRKGEWRCTIPDKGLMQTDREHIYVAYIDLGNIGTKYIYGEPGNKLILVSPYSNTGAASAEQMQPKMVYGICGTDPSITQPGPGAPIAHVPRDFIMRGVNIEAIGEAHYFYALSMLINIYDCNVIVRAGGGYPVASACYAHCNNVNNCSGSVHVNATGTPDSPVIAAGSGGVFTNCFAVSKCYVSARCTVATEGVEEESNSGKISTFGSSYASWSKNNDCTCADTANGGFNDTTNPSA